MTHPQDDQSNDRPPVPVGSLNVDGLLEKVLATMSNPVAYVDRDLRYIYANAAYQQSLGITAADYGRLTIYEVLPEAWLAAVRPRMEAARAGHSQDFEQTVPDRSGGQKHLRIQYIPDTTPGHGMSGIIVILQEVTPERQRELTAQLRESQNYLRHILDSSLHGIWGLNTKGHLTFINQRALDLLGYENELELADRPMHTVVHYAHADGRPHPLADCPMYDSFINRNTHHVRDDVLWRKDGTALPVSYYSTPVIVGENCVGSVVTFEDVTHQRALEASLEVERAKSVRNAKLASLGEMSAGIAHEINNPLAIIAGTVGILPKYVDRPDDFAAKLEAMKKSCARIARIVKGLQKFSRSGDKPSFQDHELEKIVGEALVLTEAKSKRHATPVRLTGQTAARVRCDEVEIEQVVINLINNAIDAVKTSRERWVELAISDDADSVVLRVSDSGRGIPEAVRHKLFQPFFTTKDVGQGTGLGLSIVKGILDEHKASIAVLAEETHTVFEIRFIKVTGGPVEP